MAFSIIAVGVDLSPSSEVAVAQAMSLARHDGARLVLVHVGLVPEAPEGIPPSMRETAARYHGILRDRLGAEREELEALRQRLIGQGVEVSHVVVDGFPDTAVAEAARASGADLIAVGTHGRTGVSRVFLGSVAEKTVRLAESSVLVARGAADAANGGYERILVGTDFSPLADKAVERAVAAAAPGAAIEVVHAWHVPLDLTPEGTVAAALADLREALDADAARSGAALVAAWKARGVTVRFTPIEAPASGALTERAAAIGADLVVVGSHGRRGLRRFFLGSVAEATVRHAPCSVLVAR
jgi:nucleotide-binding universal stress UspA family protein